jgi:hypothetical protein
MFFQTIGDAVVEPYGLGCRGHHHKPRSMAMPSTARTMRWVTTGALTPRARPLISTGPIEDCRRLQVSDIGLPGGSKRGGGGNY